MPEVSTISAPIILFKVPEKPFYQFLRVGTHLGSVKLGSGGRKDPGIRIESHQIFKEPHEIWVAKKKPQATAGLDSEIATLMDIPEMTPEMLAMIMEVGMGISQDQWTTKCIGHWENGSCTCSRDPAIDHRICRCSQSIIFSNPASSIFSVLAEVSRIIDQTMDKTVIAEDHRGVADKAVTFTYDGKELTAYLVAIGRLPYFAALPDHSIGAINRCRQFVEWSNLEIWTGVP